MITVIVTLKVKNFTHLKTFEQEAVKIMSAHEGCLVGAYETEHHDDGTGEEVHILEFPNLESFNSYREDARFKEFVSLRKKAIVSTDVKVSSTSKEYKVNI